MTKHNGKARNSGVRVGSALTSKNRKVDRTGGKWETAWKHTTEIMGNNQSVLERNDLEELMAMADLADRDFAAERGQAVVISTGAVDPLDEEARLERRKEAEARNAHNLRLPRRPTWDAHTTPEQLDMQERTSFLAWRRALAEVEEEEKLLLTPFEKNLEVWRQLWRVLERSDIIVQVVDARDPLLYRSEDLEAYAKEINASKNSFILLNKADLLPLELRLRWADYFDKAGLQYAFWSAHAVMQEQTRLKAEASALGVDPAMLKRVQGSTAATVAAAALAGSTAPIASAPAGAAMADSTGQRSSGAVGGVEDPRVKVLDADELLELLEQRAREAIQASAPDDPRRTNSSGRLMVGLVGYPNVGKSSTINALFGSKKTAVAPTPGKTKHFQTLHISDTLCLCDCPGLVMPKYSNAKAEMVAAGVIPIDKLVDIRGPIEVVAQRVGRAQLQAVYNIQLPPPQPHESPDMPASASHLLRSLAMLRGWVVGMGLPDESRAGRQIMKDYTLGKLLYCLQPPSSPSLGWAPDYDPSEPPLVAGRQPQALPMSIAAAGGKSSSAASKQTGAAATAGPQQQATVHAQAAPGNDQGSSDDSEGDDDSSVDSGGRTGQAHSAHAAASASVNHDSSTAEATGPAQTSAASATQPTPPAVAHLAANMVGWSDADLDLLESLAEEDGKVKPKRPDHKFQKKAAREKGDRGQGRANGVFDGAAMLTGKKGGLMRVAGYV